jgi:hypothetical protein
VPEPQTDNPKENGPELIVPSRSKLTKCGPLNFTNREKRAERLIRAFMPTPIPTEGGRKAPFTFVAWRTDPVPGRRKTDASEHGAMKPLIAWVCGAYLSA